jgi:hypothetical protein
MNRKVLTRAAVLASTPAALCLLACSQGADPSSVFDPDGTSQALTTVIDCQTQAFACAADAQAPAGLTSCNSGLRSCLASLFPAPQFDASAPTLPTLPVFDAGLPPTRSFDAGLPVRPPLPTRDAGLPPPVVLPDAGAASGPACLADLQTCLVTTFDATKCAADARTCLTAADQARCDAQQAACTSSGAPKALCDAQRAACL